MKAAVVAFGGNALMSHTGKSTYSEQILKTDEMCRRIIGLFDMGYKIIITHGNGPQVGNFLMQQESLSTEIPPMPLDVCNAMTQGQIGYMIAQRLRNIFVQKKMDRSVAAFITQVVVSEDDPAFKNPTKFIGPFFTEAEMKELQEKEGWVMKEDSGRGYRRVVPSPRPVDIVEKNEISRMANDNYVVIACGGGGIPVVRDARGGLKGVAAVIDKDFAAQRLASLVNAEILMLVTPVDKVAINFGKPDQKMISRMTLAEAERYFAEGHFPPGSMGPKIEASINFLRAGGKKTIITSLENIDRAINGEEGTEIVH